MMAGSRTTGTASSRDGNIPCNQREKDHINIDWHRYLGEDAMVSQSRLMEDCEEVGSYSFTSEKVLLPGDRSCLQALKLPEKLTLTSLLENYIELSGNLKVCSNEVETTQPPENKLLRYLMTQPSFFCETGLPEFVGTSAFPIITLMRTPYHWDGQLPKRQDGRTGWTIGITKWKGTYYIKRTSFHGEHFLGFSSDFREKLTYRAARDGEFYSVVKASLGTHRALYAGQIHCYDHSNHSYIHLKTRKMGPHNGRVKRISPLVMNDWLTRNLLLNVSHTVCGFLRFGENEEDTRVVGGLHAYPTENKDEESLRSHASNSGNRRNRFQSLEQEKPKMDRAPETSWRKVAVPLPQCQKNFFNCINQGPPTRMVCTNFLTYVLGEVKELDLPDDSSKVCTLHWTHGSSKIEIKRNDTDYGKILFDEYVQKMSKVFEENPTLIFNP